MTNRRNFHPSDDDEAYMHDHITFRAMVEVDLHNVGPDFSLTDAGGWLQEAMERGLKQADPNDKAKVTVTDLLGRPKCECYPKGDV